MKAFHIIFVVIFGAVLLAACFKLFGGNGWNKENIGKKEEVVERPIVGPKDPIVIRGKQYFVSPDGNNENDGLAVDRPFLSIQKAVDMLEPGDGVILADGVYLQDIASKKNGQEGMEMVIKGSEGAIVKGTGKIGRIIEINHDYWALDGFTVDGLEGDPDNEKNYRDKLIYVQGKEPKDGVTGLKIWGMNLKNAGGECVRIKYFSQGNEIAFNKINGCGAYDFVFSGGGKNGEGIYIGTAPEQTDDDKNPTADVDRSDNNWIHDNIIDTQGNECVDIKEGASNNLVENNQCTGQKDKESAGLDSRGDANIFLNNESYGNVGAGIRVGGDEDNDGISNVIKRNYLHNNKGGGIKLQRMPQGQICENKFANNGKDNFTGEFGSDGKNAKKCID